MPKNKKKYTQEKRAIKHLLLAALLGSVAAFLAAGAAHGVQHASNNRDFTLTLELLFATATLLIAAAFQFGSFVCQVKEIAQRYSRWESLEDFRLGRPLVYSRINRIIKLDDHH